MKYEVRCECGKPHAVTAADAGSSIRCACGRTTEVPPLHQLRTAAGEAAIPLLVRVRGLVSNGQLPGTRDCVVCHRTAGGMMRVGLACEPPEGDGPTEAVVTGCLLVPLLGWLTPVFMAGTAKAVRAESPDVSLVVPLPVCDACRSQLNDPAVLGFALRRVPEYAELLDQYPSARVHLRK